MTFYCKFIVITRIAVYFPFWSDAYDKYVLVVKVKRYLHAAAVNFVEVLIYY